MSEHPLTSWPPTLTDEQLQALTLQATTYALSHGLVYLPVGAVQPPVPTSTIHAPLALFPSPIPRTLFAAARRLQSTYNVLYARVACDSAFLDRVMGAEAGVGRADEFTGELWRRWKQVRAQGVAQVCGYSRLEGETRSDGVCSRCSLGCLGRTIWCIRPRMENRA